MKFFLKTLSFFIFFILFGCASYKYDSETRIKNNTITVRTNVQNVNIETLHKGIFNKETSSSLSLGKDEFGTYNNSYSFSKLKFSRTLLKVSKSGYNSKIVKIWRLPRPEALVRSSLLSLITYGFPLFIDAFRSDFYVLAYSSRDITVILNSLNRIQDEDTDAINNQIANNKNIENSSKKSDFNNNQNQLNTNNQSQSLSNNIYAQCISGNCDNGYGIMQFPDKSEIKKYTGDWKNGQYNGNGKLEYKNGDFYEGNFLNSNFEGKGKYQFSNGNYYFGTFNNGYRNGFGEEKEVNGTSYKGLYVKDNREGNFTITYAEGNEVKGIYSQGVFYPENKTQTTISRTDINNNPVNKQNYTSAIMGSKEWMIENLNVTNFNNGDVIPQAKNIEDLKNARMYSKPMWCYYDFDPSTEAEYGKLYNYYAVEDPRGIVPAGFILPEIKDFHTLNSYSNFQITNGRAVVSKSEGREVGTNKKTSSYNADFNFGSKKKMEYVGYKTPSCGFYWSSTIQDDGNRYLVRTFVVKPSVDGAEEQYFEKSAFLSVRGIRGVQNTYNGNWNNGKKNGKGVESYFVLTNLKGFGDVHSGDKYDGYWVDGFKEGDGSITSNGLTKKGLWKHDEFIGEWEFYDNRHKCSECKIKPTKSIKKSDIVLNEEKNKAYSTKIGLYNVDLFCSEVCKKKAETEFLNSSKGGQEATQNKSNSQKISGSQQQCSHCSGTGKCSECDKTFKKRYYGGKYKGWKVDNVTQLGYILCSDCNGAGVKYGVSDDAGNPEETPCHVSNCNHGFRYCNTCNTNGNGTSPGKCKYCKGTGIQK